MEIMFLGAAGTVTGSKYLLTAGDRRVLVDCGLFQGFKQLRLRNREPFAVDPASIDAVVLTHAHLDHTGYLPLLVRDGFAGAVYCTGVTRDLCGILLPDSGRLQEEEAAYANRHGYSRHHPALPLYTERDAERCLALLRGVPFEQSVEVADGVTALFQPAGHLLGAAIVTLGMEGTRLLFSGDLGRPEDPILPPPAVPAGFDFLVVESTYGDRLHPAEDPLELLARTIRRTAARGGTTLIPSFAVGRAQHLLYLIHRLLEEGRIPELPVYLDSPMAARATRVFWQNSEGVRLSATQRAAIRDVARAVESVEESKSIDRMTYPRLIISASGMATGGRVLHHLKVLAPDPRNTILFTGHQAPGTRGATMLAGGASVKIHGEHVPVRAAVETLGNLSGHADQREILAWLRQLPSRPRETFITHGEPSAADALRLRIEEELHWKVRVPEHREVVPLAGGRPGPVTSRRRSGQTRGDVDDPALVSDPPPL